MNKLRNWLLGDWPLFLTAACRRISEHDSELNRLRADYVALTRRLVDLESGRPWHGSRRDA
jgi:hypothetical protein